MRADYLRGGFSACLRQKQLTTMGGSPKSAVR